MSDPPPEQMRRLMRCQLPLAVTALLSGCAASVGGRAPQAGAQAGAQATSPAPAAAPPAPAAATGPAAATSPASAGTTAAATSPAPARRPRIGLALGGGAARGFAHVGVIEVLERAGFRPDLVVGTSAGSLVGALYASGMPPAVLRRTALSLEEGVLGDWSLSVRGLLRGKALQDLVNRLVVHRPIERFAIPFAAIACDLYDGRAVQLRAGDAGLAVRASSAVPGVFEPVAIGGREYVDGGLVSPVPVRAARALGADYVIAVDIAAKPRFQETGSLPKVLLQTFAIMSQHLAVQELRDADLVLSPAVGDLSSADFGRRALAIEEGERAALAALPALRAAMKQTNIDPRRG